MKQILITLCAEGQQLRYCGYAAGHDDIIIKGNPEEMKVCDCIYLDPPFSYLPLYDQFIAYYVKQGKVVAVARCVTEVPT